MEGTGRNGDVVAREKMEEKWNKAKMVSVVQESVRQKEVDTGKFIWRGREVNAGTDWEGGMDPGFKKIIIKTEKERHNNNKLN